MAYFWGVDSARDVTDELYECVERDFGKPTFWGRYLVEIEGKVSGLTREEVRFIRTRGTKILPIFSNFQEATGFREGKMVAQNTIYHAKRMGVPRGKVLFANLERYFKTDEAWIRGFVEAMYPSGYRAGLYHDPVRGEFSGAYCKAVERDAEVANQLILWSAEPEPGPSRARNAPTFRPKNPPCKANVWGWQYGRDSKVCPIDTNLINSRLYDLLW